MERQINLVR